MRATFLALLSAVALAAGMLLPRSALAASDAEALCYTECGQATRSTPDYAACVAKASEKADAALNDAYEDLQAAIRKDAGSMQKAPEPQLSSLTAAQEQWLAFRDANCTLESDLAFGGSGATANGYSCRCALSYERIGDFERIKSQVMGD